MQKSEILLFSVLNLRSGEQLEYYQVVLSIVERLHPDTSQLDSILLPMKEALKAANEQFKSSASNKKLTQQLNELDDERRNAMICLRQLVEGYTRYYDKAVSQAAEAIQTVIDRFGGSAIYRLNYEEETATLRNLLSELTDDPPYQKAVKTVGLDKLLKFLKEKNDAFSEMYLNRIQQETADDSKSTRVMLTKVRDYYRELVRMLESLAVVSPTDYLFQIIAEINTVASRQEEILKDRRSRNRSDEEEIIPPDIEEAAPTDEAVVQ